MSAIKTYEIKFFAEAGNIRKACNEIEDVLKLWKIEASLILDIIVSIDEALTNIVMHAFNGIQDNNHELKVVLIEVVLTKNVIEFILKDKGIEFDFKNIPKPDVVKNINEGKVGGYGVFLIRSLMDSVDVFKQDKYNVMVLGKKL